MNLAPIVIFVYNRPEHTERTLEALSQNDLASESDLFIYADGPKPNASAEQRSFIAEVRKLIRKKQWCKYVHIIESEKNKGLADSIVDGVTEIVNRCGKVIVLEDDIVVTRGFLKYMNDALEMYKDDEQVMQVSAYIYPHKYQTKQSTVFLKIMSCWGWATWQRAWKYYQPNVDIHLSHFQTKEEIKKFNIEGHARYYEQLVANKTRDLYTWAVKWYASWLYCGGITLFPTTALVRNCGFDNSGTNCSASERYFDVATTDYLPIEVETIQECASMRKSIDAMYKQHYEPKAVKGKIGKFLTGIHVYVVWRKWKSLLKIGRYVFGKNTNWGAIINKRSGTDVGKHVKLQSTYHLLNVSIGDYSYIASNSHIHNTHIGKFCSIGANFRSGLGIHPTNGLSTAPMFYSNLKQNGTTLSSKKKIEEYLPVRVGNDVFIGDNVIVLSGVTIGDGAIIGAGTVVSKDVPPYAVVVGVPMKIKRYRFTQSQIDALLQIQWWNFEEDKLRDVERYFWNIDEFIRKYQK